MTLRERLEALCVEGLMIKTARADLDRRVGELLLEVSPVRRRRRGRGSTPSGLTLTEAAQILGISRQHAYALVEAAERRASR